MQPPGPPEAAGTVLLRLAGFCGAPRRALAKIGALRQTQLPVSSAGRGRCVCLLRLAGFCGAPQRALAKIGALRQLRLAVSAAGSARLSCPRPCGAASGGALCLWLLPRPGGWLFLIYDLNPPPSLYMFPRGCAAAPIRGL